MPRVSNGKKKEENSLINELERKQQFVYTGMRDQNYNLNQHFNIFLIEFDLIDKWKTFVKQKNKNKNETFKEPCKIISDFEKLKNLIYEGKKFVMLFDKDINIFNNKALNCLIKYQNLSIESYFGNSKIILYFNNNSILVITKPPNSDLKKYFITKFPLVNSKINKFTYIKAILKIDKLFQNSNFKPEYGLEFTELISGKTTDTKNNLNNTKILTNQTVAIKTIENNNNNIIINNQSINNIQINEYIQKSIPHKKEKKKRFSGGVFNIK